MAKNSRPRGRQVRRYDPGVNPFPRSSDGSGVSTGPTGNSRNQRRQRARLPFAVQAKLAESMGFEIPKDYPTLDDMQRAWINKWEALYAKR